MAGGKGKGKGGRAGGSGGGGGKAGGGGGGGGASGADIAKAASELTRFGNGGAAVANALKSLPASQQSRIVGNALKQPTKTATMRSLRENTIKARTSQLRGE